LQQQKSVNMQKKTLIFAREPLP